MRDSTIQAIAFQRGIRNRAIARVRLMKKTTPPDLYRQMAPDAVLLARSANKWVVYGWRQLRLRQIDAFEESP